MLEPVGQVRAYRQEEILINILFNPGSFLSNRFCTFLQVVLGVPDLLNEIFCTIHSLSMRSNPNHSEGMNFSIWHVKSRQVPIFERFDTRKIMNLVLRL